MPDIDITIRALTTPKLRMSSSSIINDVSNYMYNFLSDILEQVRKYPPVPVGSTYVRTNLLYDSWYVTRAYMTNRGLAAGLNNTAPYAAFVQGDFQTYVHQRNGWMRVRKLIKERRAGYRAGIQDIIRRNIRW